MPPRKSAAFSAASASAPDTTSHRTGSQTLWLGVNDEDDLEGASLLRVNVNESAEGKGKRRRLRYICTVTLYSDGEERMHDFKNFQSALNLDPRCSPEEELRLRQNSISHFRKHTRVRDENIAGDSEQLDGDDGQHYVLLVLVLLYSISNPSSCKQLNFLSHY